MTAPQPLPIESGTPAFRRINLAMFAAGFSTFALLYSVQPLLPLFAGRVPARCRRQQPGAVGDHRHAGHRHAGGELAVRCLGPQAGDGGLLLASALLTLAAAFAPNWHILLLLRALLGLALSGLPAVAMAYVGEEMHPKSVGLAMGLYISGSSLGGMGGRLLTGVLVDFVSWRAALATLGCLCLVAGVIFWRSLPQSARFRPQPLHAGYLVARAFELFRDPGLPWLFAQGFLLMGSFVTVYNYVGFRLLAPPFGLSQTVVASIFLVYLVGTVSSAAVGSLAGRIGRRRVLWAMILLMLAGLALTLADTLPLLVAGMGCVHLRLLRRALGVSSWVGIRAMEGKAQASALYLFFYYLGSSLVGSLGGLFWTAQGWPGVGAMVGVLLAAAFLISLHLARLAPIGQTAVTNPGQP